MKRDNFISVLAVLLAVRWLLILWEKMERRGKAR